MMKMRRSRGRKRRRTMMMTMVATRITGSTIKVHKIYKQQPDIVHFKWQTNLYPLTFRNI